MYAVIQTGGKQYLVKEGTRLKIENIKASEGELVEFEPLMVKKEDGSVEFYKGKVIAEVLRKGKHKKVIVFKFRAKKNYKRWKGHRQPFTEILIKEIKEV
ncbi:50S ribosomal protein L21 [Hydrogenobacter hydrogenophilus]|uniref:Large ribosomal subunit protein bL21 n=1 Tax=Hydrogenobacter hydrogenophilus TaxID=35835 RepID=A0A285NWJ6_9AQUI|nr:50S ribosomal protein L21 [Hydrogenobacter hydrogenophilus]SNZ12011.1 LSU ribosomal protein L21P [Hydrogenobacter hydrogenophilus]